MTLIYLELPFDSKMTIEKHLRSVSRAAFLWVVVLRKSWKSLRKPWQSIFHDRLLLGRCCRGFYYPRFGVLFCRVVLGCRYTP